MMDRYPGVTLTEQRAHVEMVREDAQRAALEHPDPEAREEARVALLYLDRELQEIEEAAR